MTTRLPPFRAATLKVERARKHITDINEIVTELFAENPVSIVIEDDHELREQDVLKKNWGQSGLSAADADSRENLL